MRGDDEQRVEVHGDHHFNSRLYMRGNLGHICIVIVNGNFNSRLYTRGAIAFNTHLLCKRYFNSRLYTRGDVSHSIVLPVVEDILIHTSTWEATTVISTVINAIKFQFTPLHERQRAAVSEEWWGGLNFNSRLYIRGSQQWQQDYSKMVSISIHASTREATLTAYLLAAFCINFNSRLYTRGDNTAFAASEMSADFNSRLYTRGDDREGREDKVLLYFNSRLYTRGDFVALCMATAVNYFNSRLYTRGDTFSKSI